MGDRLTRLFVSKQDSGLPCPGLEVALSGIHAELLNGRGEACA